MKFKGIITALITPFYQGELDKHSFIQLIKNQLDEGVDGFVLNGTTGESPTLKEEEVSQVVEWTKVETAGAVPLILGIGHNNTYQAEKNIQKAGKWKMDGALAVVPYYNKPTGEGLKRHFKKIAEHSEVPVLLYNVPSRTQTSLDISTIAELSKKKQIQGIKEASGDMNFAEELFSKNIKSDFSFLSGDDSTYLDFAKKGGQGVVSVSSHFMLKPMKSFLNKVLEKDATAINEFQKKYKDVLDCLYAVSNPIMIKQVMYLKKVIRSPELRLPLCEPESSFIEDIKKQLQTINS
ncbi:MAG: 4-hydroxy-tetrahydrodipicolinate synthase [Bdellovibrionales bacterium]|nr:4-hydroxy-tetrahydrodipicolinate synthase [Bdellovibrionales bacterium]